MSRARSENRACCRAVPLRCLWLTLADPDPPLNGQFLYSSGLIRAAAATGMKLDVVGFCLPGGTHRDGETSGLVNWHLAPHRPRSGWRRIVSRLPILAYRTDTPSLRRSVRCLLHRGQWSVVVIDSIALAWVLPYVRRVHHRAAPPPKLVYLAHNHEETVARRIAQSERRIVRRFCKYLDALKMAALERAVSRAADLIGSNTPEDCAKFRRRWPDKAVEFLPPGYSGRRVQTRDITAQTPRRAIIVGSFDWVAKRQSLEEFLSAAERPFAANGVELYVVGQADENFLDGLRERFDKTHFTGRVDDVAVYMKDARIAVVPDRMPGFKLKGLDYVFNRLPIFAIADSLPGFPLRDGESVEFFSDHEKLAQGVAQWIGDLDRLNGLHERAYAACFDKFDWTAIGERLAAVMTKSEHIRSASETIKRAKNATVRNY